MESESEDPEDPESSESGFLSSFSGRVPVLVLAAVIMVSLAAICGLGYLLLRDRDQGDAENESALVPTPFATSVGIQSGIASGSDAIVYGISDSSTVSVTLESPATLSLGGREYSVTRQTINPDGSWSPGVDGAGTAGWVYGSIVNYIVALGPSEDNQAAFNALGPGSQMVMTTQSGSAFVYEFAQRNVVSVSDNNIFNQHTPGITLVLLGTGEDQRQVVTGRYLITESSVAGGASPVIEVGESAQLNDLTISVQGATYVPTHTDAPPGFSFFLIDFRIVNNGSTSIDVNN